jgi:hypothetical protein
MPREDQFTAIGPAQHDSGFPFTAFSTSATGMAYGANLQGDRAGVYAEAVSGGTNRESDVTGVGAWAHGDSFGVVGRAANRPGKPVVAGVYGENPLGGSGVIGAAQRDGIGVLGSSVRALGNPLQAGQAPADGAGTGVLGRSGGGEGVRGESDRGDGVAGQSQSGRGGRFESGTTALGSIVAQVGLVPQPMPAALPAEGSGGDLLATQADDGTCALWFCVRSAAGEQPAVWREVLLDDPDAPAGLTFVDWATAHSGGANGTLNGHAVSLSGPMGTAFVLDGSYGGYASASFSPRLAASDMLEIAAGPGHVFTLSFGGRVRNPVLMLGSFGSVLTVTSGGVLTKLSGTDGFSTDGPSVIDAPGDAHDSEGTVRIQGTFESLTFAAVNSVDPSRPDGILLQVGAEPA